MLAPRIYRNLALVGFMGAGKTTVGHLLANWLQFVFVDTDREIEARENRRISDVFATSGEAYFREQEGKLCRELEGVSERVISTGGGLIVDPANLESLRRHALIVCLWASPETIYNRLKHQTQRPLLQTPDPLATIRELMERRRAAYREADVLVGVDYRSPADTARHIAISFRRAQGLPTADASIPLTEASFTGAILACPPGGESAISTPS